jgi:hypothetical protein
MEFMQDISYWHWLVFGLTLIVFEMLLPSAVFLWPGLAAVAVGIMVFATPAVSMHVCVLIWAVLSVALAFGWQAYRKKNPASAPISSMNNRGAQYIGRHYTLAKDIVNGTGELNVDDTRWKVISNTDHSAGTKVKVIGLEGTSLRVEEYIS